MADNAIIWGKIWGLGSPLFICAYISICNRVFPTCSLLGTVSFRKRETHEYHSNYSNIQLHIVLTYVKYAKLIYTSCMQHLCITNFTIIALYFWETCSMPTVLNRIPKCTLNHTPNDTENWESTKIKIFFLVVLTQPTDVWHFIHSSVHDQFWPLSRENQLVCFPSE